ncbi:MAG TPA: M56 family metallopeptidase [Kofleriaceae bacterium]|nr:M56 family metallopeptidase [Kofleriaceae bacterium]
MIELGMAAKALLATLGTMAVQGTLLAVLALALVRVGRPRPAWQAAVWLVVLAKLALPWGPAMPYSLSDLFALFTSDAAGGSVVVAAGTSIAPAITPSIAPSIGWLLLASIWAIGALAVLGSGLARYRRTLSEARTARAAPQPATALLVDVATRLRVRAPHLVIGHAATGPHVVGAWRPIIVVPPALLDDPALLRVALVHELAHVARKDAFGRVIQLVAAAMFWWLPVARLASRRLELARERACDAWALEAGDVSRPTYARLLVAMSQLRTASAPALAAPHALDERVTAVLGPVVRPRLSGAHKLAIAGWALLALGGARPAAAQAQREVCVYTPAIAEALRAAYPEADVDRDGVLSYHEACEFQAEIKKVTTSSPPPILAEPLCCNCEAADGLYSPPTTSADASCRYEEGASR